MKAIQINQYGNEEQLAIVDVAQPKAGKGQVVVRILATSFNPIDPKRTSGNMQQVFPLQFPSFLAAISPVLWILLEEMFRASSGVTKCSVTRYPEEPMPSTWPSTQTKLRRSQRH